MHSAGIQVNADPCRPTGRPRSMTASGVVVSEWSGDDEGEKIRTIDLNSALSSGGGVNSGTWIPMCSYP